MASANILERNAEFIGWQIDYLSTEPLKVEGNAPVTRVKWECDNLPAGLELSESGQLSGRPTIAGNYACTVKVATNWGEATKIVNIRVME